MIEQRLIRYSFLALLLLTAVSSAQAEGRKVTYLGTTQDARPGDVAVLVPGRAPTANGKRTLVLTLVDIALVNPGKEYREITNGGGSIFSHAIAVVVNPGIYMVRGYCDRDFYVEATVELAAGERYAAHCGSHQKRYSTLVIARLDDA